MTSISTASKPIFKWFSNAPEKSKISLKMVGTIIVTTAVTPIAVCKVLDDLCALFWVPQKGQLEEKLTCCLFCGGSIQE